jgi:cysteine sulfinate desulfinase/cysteine desulfurase-like protein
VLIAEDRGAMVRWLDFDPEDCTLNMAGLRELLTKQTRIVAVGYASTATGTLNDEGSAHLAGDDEDVVQGVGAADVEGLASDQLHHDEWHALP